MITRLMSGGSVSTLNATSQACARCPWLALQKYFFSALRSLPKLSVTAKKSVLAMQTACDLHIEPSDLTKFIWSLKINRRGEEVMNRISVLPLLSSQFSSHSFHWQVHMFFSYKQVTSRYHVPLKEALLYCFWDAARSHHRWSSLWRACQIISRREECTS